MTQATKATISTIAQSLGISHIKESISSKLAHNVKRDILKILCDAVQIMKTTKSRTLKSTHINLSLESNRLEPLFGYYNNDPDKYQLVPAGSADALDLLTYHDSQISIEYLTKDENRPYPLDTTIDFSWVAVQGNPVGNPEEQESESYEPGYNDKNEAKQYVQQMVKRQNLEQDFAMSSKHFISYELKLYNQTSRQLLLSPDIHEREKMLYTIRKEKCIETLVPYYIQFAEKEMCEYPKDFEKLFISVSVARALTQNDDISVDIYMQQLISIALTLLVSLKVSPINFTEQYIIRDNAAELLKSLVEKSVVNYPNAQPTLTSQLLTILVSQKNTPAQKYGALNALQKFGLETISEFVSQVLPKVINDSNLTKNVHQKNIEQVTRLYDCAVTTAGLCIHSDSYRTTSLGLSPMYPKSLTNYREIMDTFGSDLQPYFIDDSALLSI